MRDDEASRGQRVDPTAAGNGVCARAGYAIMACIATPAANDR